METYDIAGFTVADMAECSMGLRHIGEDAESMEETAGRIVAYLYEHFSAQGQQGPLALVRLFKTHPYTGLTPGIFGYRYNDVSFAKGGGAAF